ncbi:MAG TPA: hypothetical protein VFV87_19515 [Pirellulaceae bacterium]|nr:hypothetical protein [Pirellulaceae bacterium]
MNDSFALIYLITESRSRDYALAVGGGRFARRPGCLPVVWTATKARTNSSRRERGGLHG